MRLFGRTISESSVKFRTFIGSRLQDMLHSSREIRTWIAALSIVAVGMSFMVDLHLTRKHGGVDLRDKVVAARSLAAGRSLYYHPWRPGEPERFADPSLTPGTIMTRYTGSPFQALLMVPMAGFTFTSMHLGWLFMQYALLLGAILLMYLTFGSKSRPDRIAMALFAVILVSSDSWRLHVERGQVYVIFAFLIAAMFISLARKKEFLFGVLAVTMVLLKPPALLIFVPLAFRGTRRIWAGGIAMVLVTAGIFAVMPHGMRSWQEYFNAMKEWSSLMGAGGPSVVYPGLFAYPATIEGSNILTIGHSVGFEDGSVFVILKALGILLPKWTAYATVMVFFSLSGSLLWKHFNKLSSSDLLLLGFCGWLIFMLMLPVPRFNYQFVLWTAPLCYALLNYRDRPFGWSTLMAFAAILILGGWSVLPVNVLLAEGVFLGLLLYYVHFTAHHAPISDP